MQSILVANPKGGAGKSTLATNLAGYFAAIGEPTMLGDIDRQQSSRAWLARRSPLLPAIDTWEIRRDQPARPPAGCTRAVLDSPAGLRGKRLEAVLKVVHRVIVPVQPSLFDMLATGDFLDRLLDEKAVRKERAFVALVAMRVDARTRAAAELQRFLAEYRLPVLAWLRDTQRYVQLAAHGMTLFDLSVARAAPDLEQWQAITDWLDSDAAPPAEAAADA